MANAIINQTDIQNFAPELDLSSYNAATISGMCSQATNRAAQFCSVDGFDFTTVTGEVDRALISNDGELVISTRRRPIVSVSSIVLKKGGFSTTLVLTDTAGNNLFQIPHPNNKLVFPNSYFYLTGTYLAGGSSQLYTLRGAKVFYEMAYTAGYQTIPDDLKYACLLYFRDQYSKKFNTRNLSSFTQGSYSESYSGNSNKHGKSPLELEAEGVLMSGGYARMEF